MNKENGSPSQYDMFEINLQLFADGEPAPVDVPAAEPAPTEPTEGTPAQPNVEPTEAQKIKVKFNHQEMELPYDEAVTHIQKGMNYDKAIERAKQEARDEYIASQGYEWNGKPIKTESEYQQAMREKEIYDKYKEQGLPDEVIEKLAKVDQIELQLNSEKQTKAEQQRKENEYKEFFEYFKGENGRDFDSTKDIIPDEVWAMVDKGKTLTDAYAYHTNKQLKAKVAEYEAKLKAQETNQVNAATSTGSVTGNGNAGDGFISAETFEQNKNDQNWINKNYKKLMESRAKW